MHGDAPDVLATRRGSPRPRRGSIRVRALRDPAKGVVIEARDAPRPVSHGSYFAERIARPGPGAPIHVFDRRFHATGVVGNGRNHVAGRIANTQQAAKGVVFVARPPAERV